MIQLAESDAALRAWGNQHPSISSYPTSETTRRFAPRLVEELNMGRSTVGGQRNSHEGGR